MSKKPPNERLKAPAVGRVPLDDIPFMSEKLYTIGNLKWSVSRGRSMNHGFNEIMVSTMNLEDEERIHVELEIHVPKHLPNRMTFWHVFDNERHAFCIPYTSDEKVPAEIAETNEGQLQKGRPTGSYLRISLNPKIWKYQNWQFPFADLVLKIGNEELYVNRRILAASSRFFVFIMERGRVKCMKNHDVLYVRDVSFEDLYDLMGCIYHGWMFYSERALHLQSIAELFGVHLDANNALSFEGRTSMEHVPLTAYDAKASRPRSKCELPIRKRLRKLTMRVDQDGNEYADEDEEEEEDEGRDTFEYRHVFNPPSRASSESSANDRRSISPVERPVRINFYVPPRQNEEPMEQDNEETDNEDETSDNDDARSYESHRIKIGDSAPPTYIDCQKTLIKNNRMYYKFSFDFDPSYSEKFLSGGKFSIQTCFGCWDFYLYPKMINSQKFLALGIYGTRFSPSFINDIVFLIKVQGGNRKPTKKILQKVISSQQNTLGYPNFLPWSEVENYSEEGGLILFNVQLSAQLTNLTSLPELNYDSFPGRKDVFVRIEDIVMPVSRDVLSEASPVLKEMFDEPFILNRKQIFDIQGITYNGFIVLLDYIYNKKAKVEREDYVYLMDHAARFEMHSVVDQLCRDLVFYEEFNETEAYYFAVQYEQKTFMYKYYSQLYDLDRTNVASLIRK